MVSFTTILALAAAAVAAPLHVRPAPATLPLGILGYGSNFHLQQSSTYAAAADASSAISFTATNAASSAVATVNGQGQLVSGEYVAVKSTSAAVSWEKLSADVAALTCSITGAVVSCADATGAKVFSANMVIV